MLTVVLSIVIVVLIVKVIYDYTHLEQLELANKNQAETISSMRKEVTSLKKELNQANKTKETVKFDTALTVTGGRGNKLTTSFQPTTRSKTETSSRNELDFTYPATSMNSNYHNYEADSSSKDCDNHKTSNHSSSYSSSSDTSDYTSSSSSSYDSSSSSSYSSSDSSSSSCGSD